MNFYDGLEQYDGNIALVHDGKTMTYAGLAAQADRVAACLPARSLVFLACQNSPEVPVGYLGMLRRRAVPVMVNPALHEELLRNLMETYRPNYMWCPQAFWPGEALVTYGDYKLVALDREMPDMDPALALLLTTSGSTGSPKLVRQTYENIDSNTDAIVQYLGIRPEDRAITTLPMSYTYGLSILQSHLAAGARLILTEKTFLQKEFWELFRREQATTFGGVPYTYEMLDRLRFLRMELPSLRYVTQAGGKLSKELHFKFADGLRKMGCAFVVMYGATEATARMAYVPAEMAVEKAGSIGVAIPGGRFELMDVDGSIIGTPGQVGELVYYGRNVTQGYAQSRADLSKGDEWHGRLETGDMAMFDADGYYYVVGRKKRFLKLYGNRVNLMELEGLLAAAGFACACVGEDDHLQAYTTSEDLEGVVDFLAETTHINRAAFRAIHIDAIPRNEAGKVLYSELK